MTIAEVLLFKNTKYVLTSAEIPPHANSKLLAETILARIGLEPRKSGSTEDMHKVLLELYERVKRANKEKKPELAVMTVEELAIYASITRQTMYEYLKRWIDLNLIVKTSYIKDAKAVIGYRLNGTTLVSAFEKAQQTINNNLELTVRYVQELQRLVKNEKLQKQSERQIAEQEA